MAKRFTITKKAFLAYMFSDHEDIKYWGDYFIAQLKEHGKIGITTHSMFKDRDTLPSYLFEDQLTPKEYDEIADDVGLNDIKLVA